MKERAVVVGAFGAAYESLAEVTHPPVAAYAARIGADFVRLRSRILPRSPGGYEKLQIGTILGDYERVLWMDTDMLVRADTPDLFEVVPKGIVGAMDHWPYNPENRELTIRMTLLQAKDLDVPPPPRMPQYFNSGVLVVDRSHRDVFRIPDGWLGDYFQEQCLLNLRVWAADIPFKDITSRYNHMWKLSPAIDAVDRFDDYIIHYFGMFSTDRYNAERGGRSWERFMADELVMLNRRAGRRPA